jgi:general secretion pathway protein G
MSTSTRKRSARRAFTLLEVIIAVTIVALLASLTVPRMIKFLAGAHEDKAIAEVNTLAQQVRLYITTETTGTLNSDFMLENLLDGDDPYLENESQLIDPWGNEYELRIPGDINRDFDVVSLGADQEPSDDDIVHGSSR